MSESDLADFFRLDKRIYIEFVNADMDGELLDSDTGPPVVRHFVKMIYVTTDGGQVGKSIASIPFSKLLPYMQGMPIDENFVVGAGMKSLNHRYTIVNRLDEGGEVFLQVRHSVRDPDFEEQPQTRDA
jgi:hypothetical protein